MRTPAILAFTLCFTSVACGSSTQGTSGGSTGAGGSSGGSGTTTSAASTTGAGSGAGAPDGGARGAFECHGCLCDGATHYCQITEGGAAPSPQIPGPPPLPACDDADGGASNGCIPLPSACLSDVQCLCLEPEPGACPCMDMGAGLQITCMAP